MSSCRTGGGRKRELVADSIGAAMEAHEGEVAAERCGVSVSAVSSEARFERLRGFVGAIVPSGGG